MPTLHLAHAHLLAHAADEFRRQFQQSVMRILYERLTDYFVPPSQFVSFVEALREARVAIHQEIEELGLGPDDVVADTSITIDDSFDPVLKTVVLRERRILAQTLDKPRGLTSHPEVWAALDERLAPWNALMEEAWFKATSALETPKLTDVLNLQDAEESLGGKLKLQSRQYDEKFRILQAPTLFLPDLAFYRTFGELRGNSLAVAFVDIDKFKRLNSKYGETSVDMKVLPIFMRTLEAFTFGRGHAYRMGGDEYLLLLPSCDESAAVFLLNRLRIQISDLRFPDVDDTLTVSIGVCVVEQNSIFTDREVIETANRAKATAKSRGGDCVVSDSSGPA